jgi:hypothetical protein
MEMDTTVNERRIMVQTANGGIEGTLRIAAQIRTLDDLNVGGKPFIVLNDPVFSGSAWAFNRDPISINKRSILFVQEISGPPKKVSTQITHGQFTRASLQLQVSEYKIEGFLHVSPGGSPMLRLNQDSHDFISMTSVSVLGTDAHFAAPFLAINRHQIMAAQELGLAEPVK